MTGDSILILNDDNFDDRLATLQKPILVDFWAGWCAPCKKLDPIVHDLAGEYDDRMKVVKVDVDQAQSVAARFGIIAVPTPLRMTEGWCRTKC